MGFGRRRRFFDASARVPLIIRWPAGFDGTRVVEENVNLCDLFATLCDLGEIPLPEGLDSRSLVPLLQGNGAGWSNETISQYGNYLMIKQDQLKYQYYGPQPDAVPADPGYKRCDYDPGHAEVLFDLEHDPDECRNVVGDPAHAEALEGFRQRCTALSFGPDVVSGDGGR